MVFNFLNSTNSAFNSVSQPPLAYSFIRNPELCIILTDYAIKKYDFGVQKNDFWLPGL